MSLSCSIAPLLSVRQGAKAVKFYQEAFEATEVFRVEDPGGAVVARLSVDGAEFWVSDESPQHQNFSPETLGGGTVRMVMVVDNPVQRFARALDCGAREVWAVRQEHGWLIGRLVDPFGHHWEIGRPLVQG